MSTPKKNSNIQKMGDISNGPVKHIIELVSCISKNITRETIVSKIIPSRMKRSQNSLFR
jgi:hypothetical protein